MTNIRETFDAAKPINRRIEKVITYGTGNEDLLKQEIQEYVATENIEENMDKLLDRLEEGMSGSGGNVEVGVWVSGFYGSGKSSFTKYLGFALDPTKQLGGKPFVQYLQDQIKSNPVRTRLGAVAKKHPAAVIMLDLAGEQLAGATLAEISTVLYAKVMQWAGYSRDAKIAYLEAMLEKDGKLDEFKKAVESKANGMIWDELKDQPLATKALASQVAPQFYPNYFPDPKAFNDIKMEELLPEDRRVKEMIDLIARKAKTDNIILIVDEVGNYVAGRRELITNLDGLAKNLKNIGRGKVWLIATAQQMLTEDDPRAAVNTHHLGQLKDRFPIRVDLQASDIKEICYSRLLGKSKTGAESLSKLFDSVGPQLRHAIKLENTKFYRSDLDKDSFLKYYPFLPHHFEILLRLLGRLAKSRGGVGLRSAIKVIQDVLVEHPIGKQDQPLFADEPIGALATAVRFYDTLRSDIEQPFPHITAGVQKAQTSFGGDSLHAQTAKSIAILQILDDLPVSRANVAAMMHAAVDASSRSEEVAKAVDVLMADAAVPLSEVDGNLRFMSEAVLDLEGERLRITPRSNDLKSIRNIALRDIFSPTPSVNLHGTRKVGSGIQIAGAGMPVSLAGDKEPLQTIVQLGTGKEYDKIKDEAVSESVQKSASDKIFLVGHDDDEIEGLLIDIYRCREIYKQHRNKAVDKEVEEYLRAQDQRAEALTRELTVRIEKGLSAGSFIFRGRPTAVSELDTDITKALANYLGDVAEEVFHKYSEAARQADSGTAERFLKTDRLDRIAMLDDPLELVRGGAVDRAHKALGSISSYLQQHGQVEGRRLLDDFYAAPYGWTKDTTRYLVAAMLVGGMIKLRVAGEDVTVRGDTAMACLRNTNGFNRVGVALRDNAPPAEAVMRARDRLLDLTGDEVLPLEEEVSKCVIKHFPEFQKRYAPLAYRLKAQDLAGVDRAEAIQESLSELLRGDASDAANRLGGEDCPLAENLAWAREAADAFDKGLGEVVGTARELLKGIAGLPASGSPGTLREKTETERKELVDQLSREDVHRLITDLRKRCQALEDKISAGVGAFLEELNARLKVDAEQVSNLPEWTLLGAEDRERLGAELDALGYDAPLTLAGMQSLMADQFKVNGELTRIAEEVKKLGKPKPSPETETVELVAPRGTITREALDELLSDLQEIGKKIEAGKQVYISWK